MTIYHIQLTLNYANRACGVCRYHITDGRYNEDCLFSAEQSQGLTRGWMFARDSTKGNQSLHLCLDGPLLGLTLGWMNTRDTVKVD